MGMLQLFQGYGEVFFQKIICFDILQNIGEFFDLVGIVLFQ